LFPHTHEDDAVVQAAANEQALAKDTIHHWLQRELINTIQGELVKLTSMASQLVVSIGKQSSSAHAR
jgi:hypothetical protein